MEQLNLIFRVARMANVPAETHEAVAKAAQELAKILQPETKSDTVKDVEKKFKEKKSA
jgi:hypothetical protein